MASPTPVPSGADTTVDACALLSAADVSRIVGAEAASTALPGAGWVAGQCAWASSTSSFIISIVTAASIRKAGDAAPSDAKASLEDFKQRTAAGGGTKDVAGIGDGAVLAATGIAAYKGDTYMEVVGLQLTDEQLVEIAKLAIAQL